MPAIQIGTSAKQMITLEQIVAAITRDIAMPKVFLLLLF